MNVLLCCLLGCATRIVGQIYFQQSIFLRLLLDSPYSSHSRLYECAFLTKPYDGSVCHETPLMIYAAQFCLSLSNVWIALVRTAVDCVVAVMLGRILTNRAHRKDHRGRCPLRSDGDHAVALHMLNPCVIMGGIVTGPTQMIITSSSIGAIYFMEHSKPLWAARLAAVAGFFGVYPAALIIPICTASGNIIRPISAFLASIGVLTVASTALSGDWGWLDAVYGSQGRVDDLSPNLGLAWYLLTETFPHFRSFFLVLFHALGMLLIPVLAARFKTDPLAMATTLTLALSIVKTSPTMEEFGLTLSLLSLWPDLIPRYRNVLLAAILVLACAVLLPVFRYTWLNNVGGNANFFYATTLLFCCAQLLILSDFMWAVSGTVLFGKKMI